ncbi:MAG: rhomboid family intramembrane serine protease [Phycisphaerae bacterium]
MIIPIRTETPIRRTPTANYLLIAANVFLFILLDFNGSANLLQFKDHYLVLHTVTPALHEFLTYQFIHADGSHLLGNMVFLWVFGNAVNGKMGNATYVLFYLASGVFAAFGFALFARADMLGASGAIAGVTTAYLVLFPRSHVTVLYFLFFIGTFELPALLLIGLKIVLWDNVIAPQIAGAGNVAVGAHLAGYLFGSVVTLVLLAVRFLPRDQFDMLALVKRWNHRRAYKSVMADPQQQAQARFGRVAQPVRTPQEEAAEQARRDEIGALRARISECLDRGDVGAAATLYEQLIGLDTSQTLSAAQQISVAREYYGTGRTPQAAAAFERYLANYGRGGDADEIRLLLGIIYARDLKQYRRAEEYLSGALPRLSDTARRDQCSQWLTRVQQALTRPVDGTAGG